MSGELISMSPKAFEIFKTQERKMAINVSNGNATLSKTSSARYVDGRPVWPVMTPPQLLQKVAAECRAAFEFGTADRLSQIASSWGDTWNSYRVGQWQAWIEFAVGIELSPIGLARLEIVQSELEFYQESVNG